MNEKQETVDDIAWEVRAQWQGCENCSLGELDGKDLLALVARFVAAHKRERVFAISVIRAKLYGIAAGLRALAARSDARQRGISYAVVQEVANQIENIADEGGEE